VTRRILRAIFAGPLWALGFFGCALMLFAYVIDDRLLAGAVFGDK
jgi:hypothetical protein